MKRQKTLHRFAAVAAVLLTLCLVFMMPVGAEEVTLLGADENGVITLKDDVVLSDTWLINLGETVVLDLNGHKINMTKMQDTAYQLIENKGTLIIWDNSTEKTGGIYYTDLHQYSSGVDYVSNVITNHGTLIINGGTIETLSGELVARYGYPHAIDVMGGTVIINGGKIVNKYYSAMRIWGDNTKPDSDVIMNGGEVTGAIDLHNVNKANGNAATLTINGGTIEANSANVNALRFVNFGTDHSTMKLAINDGDIKGGIVWNDYDEDYKPTQNPWKGNVLTITGGSFTDPTVLNYLGENAGVFVKLQGTFPITSTITIDDGASVILDLNGNTIMGTGFTGKEGEERHLFAVDSGSVLMILNSGNADSIISSDNSGISVETGGAFFAGDIAVFDDSENIPSTQKKIIFDVVDTGIRAYGTSTEAYDGSTGVYLDDKTKIETEGYGIAIFGPSNDNTKCYGVVVLADGEITRTHPSSGTYYGTTGITTSGNIESGDSVILLGPNAKITAVTGNSNNVGYNDAPAIMANGYAMWMIVGSTLEGDEAISMKAGELFILDGTFKATGQYYDPSETNNNGSEMTGAALSVTNTYVTGSGKDGVKIFIMGGDFESKYGHAVFSGKSNEAKDTGDVLKDFAVIGIDLLSESLESVWGDLDDDTKNLIASLGFTEEDILSALKDSIPTFKSGANKASIQISGTMSGGDIGIAVVSGKYSTDVSKYVPEGFVSVPVEDGTQYEVIIQPEDAVVVVPEVPGEVVKKDDGSSIIRNIDTSTQTVKSTTVDGNSAVIIEPKTASSGVTFEIIGAEIQDGGSVTVPEDADIKVKYPTTSVGQGGTFINLTVSIDDIAGPIPVIDFALKPEVKNAIGEQAEVIAMLSAVGNGNTNLGSETGAIEITFIVPTSVVDSLGGVSKFAVFHVKGTAVSDIPIVSITKIGAEYHIVVKADGFSTYALGIKPTVDTGNNGGGSATDTGSGNYQYYPRDVPASGIISFGTSKVVTGMELPAGSDGTVTLNIKPTFTMPENGFYAFEIDAPGYNTDAKINGGLSFQIPVSALEAAGFTAKDIVLFHGTAGEDGKITWEALPTNLVKNENGIAYYKAAINGCSPFYIGFVKDGSIINTEVVEPVTPPTETPDVPNTPGTLPPTDTPDTPETPASPAPILAVLAGLGAVAALRRK